MPMYNSSNWIVETLQSIQAQTYTDFECFIIDDGSTDDSIQFTERFIQNDRRFQLRLRPSSLKKGPSSCRNFGCSLATGSFIQFFDSDDVMHPNHLQEKINAIGMNDFVVCKLHEFYVSFDASLFTTDAVPDIMPFDDLFEAFVCGNFPMMMVAPMWRASVLKKHLPFNENLHVLEDHELYARILFESKKCAIVNKTLIYYRQSENSSMNQFYTNIQTGLQSYLQAKKSVLQLSKTTTIKLALLKMVLGVMRAGLAQKKYSNAQQCFTFIANNQLAYNFSLQRKMLRIRLFYFICKLLGRGDTYFKPMLKL